ncbi:hypothetical protein GWQ43_05630 [Alcaligenes faecalis]|uniref:hypothetical protein n=1 Tax=Alcaligenes faecalis TaxID=511 RepID=UPI00137C36B0|nr:hypothetical protein [Alcaligenes faecalis]QHS35588.1 hypothetical protein GWQ43_05630 [Alcaligenes faecalis]
MNPIDVFSIIKDIALAGAACVTGYAALAGLGAWRTELRGRAYFDVARQLAKSVYVLRDRMSYCRSPFTAAQEFPEGYRGGLGNHTNKEEGDAWAHVYANRWEPLGKAIQDFDTASLEAEALWGQEINTQCTELRGCVRSLQVDIEMFIRDKYRGGESFKNAEFARKIEAGIWDTKDEHNALTQRINRAIEKIETLLRPHLSRS